MNSNLESLTQKTHIPLKLMQLKLIVLKVNN